MSDERHHFVHSKNFIFNEYSPHVAALLEPAAAFGKNVERVRALGALPVVLVGSTAMAQLCEEKARQRLGISADDTRYVRGHGDFDPELDLIKQKERQRISSETMQLVREGKATPPSAIAEVNLGHMLNAAATLGQSSAVIDLRMGIEAIISGLVIASWTAFETLAGDSWKSALNFHPKRLAALSGKWHVEERIDSDEIDESNEELSDKKIELRDLQTSDYDLSKRMGTVLRRRYKWGVLESIRRAYSDAFARDFRDLKSAIEHPSIDALSAARNVLVHKAGIVDTEFQKRHKGWPEFSTAVVDEPLELTGPIVRDLLTASLGNATKLLEAIDKWLLSH